MQKPSYKDLEKQIKTLKGNVKGLNESKNEFYALIDNNPKMFKIIELILLTTGPKQLKSSCSTGFKLS